MTTEKSITRLILYRRLLDQMLGEGARWMHSQQVAELAGVHAAQVRRDLMAVGYTGTPAKGYDLLLLFKALTRYLDSPECRNAALVGIGRMGSAMLAYFSHRSMPFRILAAFDRDPRRVNRTLYGCPCHPMERLREEVERHSLRMAILAVPAGSAQAAAETMVEAGVRGILNFAPLPLHVPPEVFVESMDITTSLEKVAFFARASAPRPEAVPPGDPE